MPCFFFYSRRIPRRHFVYSAYFDPCFIDAGCLRSILERITAVSDEQARQGRILAVALDGASGDFKTTTAEKLAELIRESGRRVGVVERDWFIDSREKRWSLKEKQALRDRYAGELGFDPNYQLRGIVQALQDDLRAGIKIHAERRNVSLRRMFLKVMNKPPYDVSLSKMERIMTDYPYYALQRERFSRHRKLFPNRVSPHASSSRATLRPRSP